MSVFVASCSLDQLLLSEKIVSTEGVVIEGALVIPEYQRPYRWGISQIIRLLGDFSHYLAEKPKNPNLPLYLGSIILHKSLTSNALNIIDGQQRLTTLALIAFIQGQKHGESQDLSLTYDSPESQRQIARNLDWLADNLSGYPVMDLKDINLTVVVTRSEDDAYRFFETQNTGGVRLAGPDIIKAHHLRAIAREDQGRFASSWEDLGDLNSVVEILIKGRYWQKLNFREVPSHRQPQWFRSAVVKELAEKTGSGEDVAYGRVKRIYFNDGGQQHQQAQLGYELRQPINAGVNTVHFLAYFEGLRQKYLEGEVVSQSTFSHFYHELIMKLDGCSYVKHLYDACLLVYLSQFGEESIGVFAQKLFRVVYSPRVSNQKAVREASVSAFVRKNPVLDWISTSYSPDMCFQYLDKFTLSVDRENLNADKNSVKKRFISKVNMYYKLNIDEADYAEKFGVKLDVIIKDMTTRECDV